MRAKVPPLKTKEGFCGPYNKPRCEICKHSTKPQYLICTSKNVVYLFTCKTCHKQYTALKNFGVDSIITDVCVKTF